MTKSIFISIQKTGFHIFRRSFLKTQKDRFSRITVTRLLKHKSGSEKNAGYYRLNKLIGRCDRPSISNDIPLHHADCAVWFLHGNPLLILCFTQQIVFIIDIFLVCFCFLIDRPITYNDRCIMLDLIKNQHGSDGFHQKILPVRPYHTSENQISMGNSFDQPILISLEILSGKA